MYLKDCYIDISIYIMNKEQIDIIIHNELRASYNTLQMQYYYARKAKGISKQIIPKEQQKKRGRKPRILVSNPIIPIISIIDEDKKSLDKGIRLDD